MIMPIACDRFISPEFTKLTVMTVEAVELLRAIVAAMPTNTAFILLEVARWRMLCSLSPAIVCSPPDIIFMPNKNSPKPPATKVILPSSDSIAYAPNPFLAAFSHKFLIKSVYQNIGSKSIAISSKNDRIKL